MIRKSDSTDAENQLTAFQTPTPILKHTTPKSGIQDQDCKAAQIPSFTPKKVLGNGAFGKLIYTELIKNEGFVFEAVDENSQKRVALKRTQKAGNVVSREYEILSMVKGLPNVIQMVNFFYSYSATNKLIQNTVIECCDGSLEDKLKQADKYKKPMTMEEIKSYVKQIFNGLAAMHELGIAHRDLKPENILLKIPGNDKNLVNPLKLNQVDGTTLELKICDLGAAKVLDKVTKSNTPYVVSRYYRAPELILGSNKYDESIDVWATGCIIFELITRTPMFPGDAEGMQILEMAMLKGAPTEDEFARLGKLCEIPVLQLLKRTDEYYEVDLARLMMSNSKSCYDPVDIEKAADLIRKCLKWVPEDRISAREAMSHSFFR